MDRQALLEQKRQRLQQLKLRRVVLAEVETVAVSESLKTTKDFSAQVNFSSSTSITYNKGIQVDQRELKTDSRNGIPKDQETAESNTDSTSTNIQDLGSTKDAHITDGTIPQSKYDPDTTAPTSTSTHDTTRAHAEPIEPSFLSALSRLNKTLSLDPSLSSLFAEFCKTTQPESTSDSPFVVSLSVTGSERPVCSMAVSKSPVPLMVVAFSKPKPTPRPTDPSTPGERTRQSPGLAVVYSLNNSRSLPEYFLECHGEISKILVIDTKIIAGLVNGSIVVWDLVDIGPSTISSLPTLRSSLILSVGTSLASGDRFIHHTSKVVLLDQVSVDSTQLFVSVCSSGILNVWTPSFLATPKLQSVKLPGVAAKTGVLLKSSNLIANLSLHQPDYKFLDRMVLGTNLGKLVRLSNTDPAIGAELASTGAVLSIADLGPVMVSAHMSWHLSVWKTESNELVVSVPITFIPTNLAARPGHELQFIAAGAVEESKLVPVLHFFDFNVKVMGPVLAIPLHTENIITAVAFSPDGNEIIAGFNDGSITTWTINQDLELTASDVDYSIHSLLA